MTIIEKLEGRIDKYIKEECIKQDLKRIVSEMLPLRAFENETENYCRDYLYTDGKEPEELLPGAIDGLMAPALRRYLLSVIQDDKDTFGYLYYRLSCEYNNNYPMGLLDPIRDNIPNEEKILDALEKEKLAEQQIDAPAPDIKEMRKEEAIKIFNQYEKAQMILKKAQEKGFFDENFNFPKETRHEQLGIFAYEFCRKMKHTPFTDNGTNYALFDKLFGLKVGTLGKVYREGKDVDFGENHEKIKQGVYGDRYLRALMIFNFFKQLKI